MRRCAPVPEIPPGLFHRLETVQARLVQEHLPEVLLPPAKPGMSAARPPRSRRTSSNSTGAKSPTSCPPRAWRPVRPQPGPSSA